MTILQALDSYYERMAARGEAEAPGWSRENFGWCLVIDSEGKLVDVQNLHNTDGKKPKVERLPVPASFPRPGITPKAFFLWDKTAFSLGVAKSKSGNKWEKSPQQHEAFKTLHRERLTGTEDEGLLALLRFIEAWKPEQFDAPPFAPEMLDANIMFRLDGDLDETGRPRLLHNRPAARALVEAGAEIGEGARIHCLVTGASGTPARLHPVIKGVDGAQSSGASLVSFNLEAFSSYGKEQGDNAPTSALAAFRYGTALNRMLERGSSNRLSRPIGDATIVFWADASEAKVAQVAEDLWASVFEPEKIEDEAERRKIGSQLRLVAEGRPVEGLDAGLVAGTRFHVLGLSPNAARLSVRFWLTDSFGAFARRLHQHHEDLRIEPSPRGWVTAPSVGRLLVRSVAALEKFENIPPLLAGEVMRSILTGARYPQSLLAAAIMRLRAGDDPATGWHAAVIRAVLARDQRLKRLNPDNPGKGEIPVSLNREHPNAGYQLGRLFAVYELAQRSALGKVNATIRDKYFGAASATPASVFPVVIRGAQNHLSKVRKEKPGWANLIEKELEEIYTRFSSNTERTLPRSLRLQDQGEFAIGYYHQRATKLTNDKGEALTLNDDNSTDQENDE